MSLCRDFRDVNLANLGGFVGLPGISMFESCPTREPGFDIES
jgi:hypothetical protein